MACFLIDYENKAGKALENISLLNLTEEDEIIFFHSKNTTKITLELHLELEKTPAKKVYISADTGIPNALDFQLSSYLGACIQENPGREYCIVSKDTDYDCVCSFWQKQDFSVRRLGEIYEYVKPDKRSV